MWRLCKDFFFPVNQRPPSLPPNTWRNFSSPTKQECGESLGNLDVVYHPFPTSNKFSLPAAVMTQTCSVFVDQVFIYLLFFLKGELPWTPPLARGCDRRVRGSFVEQVVFLTATHRGPLPLRELHSTDETRVWRDPGGS